jgi:ABC-type uncharacterized transport system permease subunit
MAWALFGMFMIGAVWGVAIPYEPWWAGWIVGAVAGAVSALVEHFFEKEKSK